MQVHGALVDGRVRARRLDRPQHLARAGVDQHEAVGRGRAQRDPRGRIVVGALGDEARWRARAGSRPRSAPRRTRAIAAPRIGVVLVAERRLVGGAQQVLGVDLGAVAGRGSPPRPAAPGTRPGAGRRTGRARPRRRCRPPARGRAARRAPTSACRLATVPGNVTQIAASSSPMSMPSSSASVATTPSSSPSVSRRWMSWRCGGRVAGAVGSDALGRARASSRSRAWRRISSTPLRDFMKQIVRAPAAISSENTSAASYSAEPRSPSSSSSSGGFHIATRRSARWGAPSCVDQVEVAPGRSGARPARAGWRSWRSRAGTAARCRGSRRRRRSRRSTLRDVRAEHAAVDVRLVDDHERQVGEQVAPGGWWGRIPTWSMSGLVRIRLLRLRIAARSRARRVAVVDRRADRACAGRRRAARAPDPGRAPWSDTGTAPARVRIGGQDLERRELEAQRLARRRSGGDDRRALEGACSASR